MLARRPSNRPECVNVMNGGLDRVWVRPLRPRAEVAGVGEQAFAASSRAADEFQLERQARPATAALIAQGLGRSTAEGSRRPDAPMFNAEERRCAGWRCSSRTQRRAP